MASTSFVYTGAQVAWVVPTGITSVVFDVVAGEGGYDSGAAPGSVSRKGGRVQGTLTTTPGETLRVIVGQKGPNAAGLTPGAGGVYLGGAGTAGGTSAAGGGGGQSFIKRGGTNDAFRVVVAGAGGGEGTAGSPGSSDGGTTLDTEATASVLATAGTGSGSGGGGSGWRGGAGAGGPGSGVAGTSMAHSTQTSGVTSTSGFQTGNGYVAFTYADPPNTLQKAATLYPINSTTVDSGAGLDVRALSDTEPGATDTSQSILNSTQASNAERRWDPATASDTTVSNASSANVGEGWAIPTAGMDPSDTRCVASLLAQTCTVNMSGTASGTGTGNVGANDVLTPRASLWKWNTSTDTATLIAGGSGTAVTISAQLAYAGTAWSGSVAITVPATTFGPNEVLMIVIGGNLACGAGLLSGARTTTWILSVDVSTTSLVFSGASGSNNGLRRKCAEAQSNSGIGTSARTLIRPRVTRTSTAIGTATKTRVRVRGTRIATAVGVPASTRRTRDTRTATGVGTVARNARARATRTATGVGTASSTRRVRVTRAGNAVGTVSFTRLWRAFREDIATAIGVPASVRRIRATRIATGIGVPSFVRHLILLREDIAIGVGVSARTLVRARASRQATGVGVPSFTRQWTASRSAQATGVGVTTFQRVVIFVRSAQAIGRGTVTGRIELPIDDLPDIEGGGTTIIRKFFPQGE